MMAKPAAARASETSDSPGRRLRARRAARGESETGLAGPLRREALDAARRPGEGAVVEGPREAARVAGCPQVGRELGCRSRRLAADLPSAAERELDDGHPDVLRAAGASRPPAP